MTDKQKEKARVQLEKLWEKYYAAGSGRKRRRLLQEIDHLKALLEMDE